VHGLTAFPAFSGTRLVFSVSLRNVVAEPEGKRLSLGHAEVAYSEASTVPMVSSDTVARHTVRKRWMLRLVLGLPLAAALMVGCTHAKRDVTTPRLKGLSPSPGLPVKWDNWSVQDLGKKGVPPVSGATRQLIERTVVGVAPCRRNYLRFSFAGDPTDPGYGIIVYDAERSGQVRPTYADGRYYDVLNHRGWVFIPTTDEEVNLPEWRPHKVTCST
jgi:hypothetical protein